MYMYILTLRGRLFFVVNKDRRYQVLRMKLQTIIFNFQSLEKRIARTPGSSRPGPTLSFRTKKHFHMSTAPRNSLNMTTPGWLAGRPGFAYSTIAFYKRQPVCFESRFQNVWGIAG